MTHVLMQIGDTLRRIYTSIIRRINY